MIDFPSLLHRPSIIHSIDPFRIVQREAISKLQALRERGAPFALVASTDFDSEFALDQSLANSESKSVLATRANGAPRSRRACNFEMASRWTIRNGSIE